MGAEKSLKDVEVVGPWQLGLSDKVPAVACALVRSHETFAVRLAHMLCAGGGFAYPRPDVKVLLSKCRRQLMDGSVSAWRASSLWPRQRPWHVPSPDYGVSACDRPSSLTTSYLPAICSLFNATNVVRQPSLKPPARCLTAWLNMTRLSQLRDTSIDMSF